MILPVAASATTTAGGLPFKRLLLVLGVVATAYAVALLVWGDSPKASLALLWSWTGAQAAALCLLNYLLRGLRWDDPALAIAWPCGGAPARLFDVDRAWPLLAELPTPF